MTHAEATSFSAPSRPRLVHSRPQPKQDLPIVKRRLPLVAGAVCIGLASWGAFLLYATNLERASSSVTRQVIFNVKNNPVVQTLLGAPVSLPSHALLSEPWISGSINMPAGNVDMSFRVKGPTMGGTVYFTSIRKDKGVPFTILRFKLIADNGDVIDLRGTTSS